MCLPAPIEMSVRAASQVGRVLGDLDLAEDAVQDAFVIAAERLLAWHADETGRLDRGTARNRAIDRIRCEKTLRARPSRSVRAEQFPTTRKAVIRGTSGSS